MSTIVEKLLLIALQDEKGTIHTKASTALPYGLAGAVLIELVMLEKIAVIDGKIVVVDEQPTANALFNHVIQIIKGKKKAYKIDYWVKRLNSEVRNIKAVVLQMLIEKGILIEERRKVLGFFPANRYPMIDGTLEANVRERLRTLIISKNREDKEEGSQERMIVLLALVNACNLGGEIFSKREWKEAKKQLKAMMDNNPFAKAVNDAVKAMEAAIYVAIAASATTSSSSSS